MTYSLQFVDSISATATVRLDLMAAPWIVRNTTQFGQPELKRSAVSTLLADGETYPAAAYGNRVITLVVQMQDATDADDNAAALQRLYRELDRARNTLLYRPDTTAPVYFRTFRATPSSVNWDPVLKQVTASIPAEPFAYGLKESVTAVTVNNDAAAGSNGLFFDLPTIKGDVDTPLFLSVAAAAVGGRQSAIAVRRGGTPSAAPFVLQAEAMTVSSDTTVQANDTTMSGAGSNFTRTTFATNTAMTNRLNVNVWPASASVDTRGTYRVFARVRKSVGTDTITVRLNASMDGAVVNGDTVTLPSGTLIRWVDISGQSPLQFPLGYDPEGGDGYSGTVLPVAGMNMSLQAARSSGTGTLDVDALIFVPADDRLLLAKWSTFAGPTAFVLDSAASNVYAVGASGEVRGTQFAELSGMPPSVTPAVANRVYFVRDVGSAASGGDDKTGTTAITPYYWPRYLSVRPVAS